MFDNTYRIQRRIQKKTYEWTVPKEYSESQTEIFFFWSPFGKEIGILNEQYWQKKRNAARKRRQEYVRFL